MSDTDDRRYMARALQLAARGARSVTPNPQVGCVIVAGGEVVGEGWHRRAGEPHAEVLALQDAGDAAQGATAYVTLEPCAHQGRTGPCCEALIAAQVGRVVIAVQDPNPLVAGKGLAAIKAAGIDVSCGVLETQAAALNRGFMRRIEHGRPWLRLKMAASLDGGTAMADGDSRWITGAEARADVQRLRAASCAVVTGIGTVLADDPQLTVRDCPADDGSIRQPLRVVIDSQLRTPPDAKILAADGDVLIVCVAGADAARSQALCAAGAEVLAVSASDSRVDLSRLPAVLAGRGCNDVMVECGATLAGALLAADLVDSVSLYMAPVLLGSTARPLFELPIATMAARRSMHIEDIRKVGEDLRLELVPQRN